jgi:hypothetical protein
MPRRAAGSEWDTGGSEASQPSPILLDLSSPRATPTDAWRLVDRWQREAELAMDGTMVPIDTWCSELEGELQRMLARIQARAETPTDSHQASYEQLREVCYGQRSATGASLSTDDVVTRTPEKKAKVRVVSPTFDESSEEEPLEEEHSEEL